MNQEISSVELGKTGIRVSLMGTGAWSWGDRLMWGFGREYQEQDVKTAFDASLEAGINFFDTAEGYGMGRSERLLGKFAKSTHNELVIGTKFIPLPWRLSKRQLQIALRNSLERLNLPSVDLYQMHFPLPLIPVESWVGGLAEAVESGLARAAGISNCNEEQMRRMFLALSSHGIPLASNQVEYSLLERTVELNGLLRACHDLDITLIAYSPLAKGVLTGKYTPDNPPTSVRGRLYDSDTLRRIQPLLDGMRAIGQTHDGKSLSQIALNWVICKGALPIPGAKNERQALENAGALGWRLSEAEVAQLDELSSQVSKRS